MLTRARFGAVLVALLVASGCSLPGRGGGSYTMTAYFPRAVSLYKSSQVRVLGLVAGKVTDIQVEGDRVRVTMSVAKDVPVPSNVQAQIVPQSLIGERYVQLFPAWKEGEPRAGDGQVIEKVSVPVEPDEALGQLNKFLQSLDPNGLGRFVSNAADDLQGNGAQLNGALDQVGRLVSTFAEKDQQLVDIVDQFDKLTTTLRTRESQLGDIIRTFSQATQVLADERTQLQDLLASLSSLSQNTLDLVVEHSDRLQTDIETLTRLVSSVDANLGSLQKLLQSGPNIANGLQNAYDPLTRSTKLRTQFGPLVSDFLNPILGFLGQPLLGCLPIDTVCTNGVTSNAIGNPATVQLPTAKTPVDDILVVLGAPTARPVPGPSAGERVADGASSVGGFFADAARTAVGAS